MPIIYIVFLIVVFFFTTVVGVVTGSNSLITVPVMFQFGIDEKVAVATNMFGLTFMSVGATIPFVRQGRLDYKKVSPLVVLTIISSAIGAALVGYITNQSLKLIVSIAMIAVGVFILVRRGNGSSRSGTPATAHLILTYVLVFFLGIYGGLYSGGYVTVLTAIVITFFGMSFSEAVASTKLINVFSSLIATLVFAWQELIDY